jgi:hypothetical protein
MKSSNVTVLPGGASPHSAGGKPTYSFLCDEGKRLSIGVTVLDYLGAGHEPDPGDGWTLPGAMSAVRERLKSAPHHSRLFCRSGGCMVAARFLAIEASTLAAFETIVFWGPTSATLWHLFRGDGVAQMNRQAKENRKGVSFHERCFESLVPTEISLADARAADRVIIATGTADQFCPEAFVAYLCTLSGARPGGPILGAPHEVTAETSLSAEERQKYFDVVFGEMP